MNGAIPRLVIAALRGGAGKTTLSLGMAAAWKGRGKKVAPFKKGPDYIDAAWLSLAAGNPCHNLDTFLMGGREVQRSFWQNAQEADIALIEGNRGLYDGVDDGGSHSTAELAKLLQAPVILIIDCDKVTRTAAAMVLGCQKLDQEVDIRGVILNRVARSRHEDILRRSIEKICHLPVVGAVPRMEDFPFPERHLGLTPPQEHARVQKALKRAMEVAEEYLNLDQLGEIAEKNSWRVAPISRIRKEQIVPEEHGTSSDKPVIGVVKDSAFQFYYPENLQALSDRGAKLIEVSAIKEKELPPVDALYIGGGFPEAHAKCLTENVTFRNSLRQAAENGLPVYAECGGLMYLGENLVISGQNFPMAGVLPVAFQMERRPQGHGYTLWEIEKENPFFPVGLILKGHEFHYSRLLWLREDEAHLAYAMKRGAGIDGKKDGLCRKNVLATFSHIHALGTEEWSNALVEKARKYRLGKKNTMAVV
ncbi:MAG: cobyrinate a,c-diamide synthase [Thermodesulfobacteriota bacterium]|nr:cobyrinate a,c-diamide synthase [Thermodesulfobacteriota bacterium]